MSSPGKIGADNYRKVEAYLRKVRRGGGRLPMRGSRVHLAKMALDCGLASRQPFYCNKRIMHLFAEFIRASGLGEYTMTGQARAGWFEPDRQIDAIYRNLERLESRMAVLERALRQERPALSKGTTTTRRRGTTH